MTPTEDLEMDDYERELVEEAWGFAEMTAGLAAQDLEGQSNAGEG
jgi:hypothetical protein